jgi:NitT/TauT family transport system permease protein
LLSFADTSNRKPSKRPLSMDKAVVDIKPYDAEEHDVAVEPATRRLPISSKHIYPVLAAMMLLGLWEAAVRFADVGVWLLPKPSMVLVTCFIKASTLLPAALVTSEEILLGFLLSVVVGIGVALAIVSNRTVEESAYPLLVATQVVPKIAVAPLLIVWLGYGLPPKIMMAFLISFFPIVVDTIVGLKSIELGKLHLVQSMGAGTWQSFVKVRLPNALPNILGGMKIASTFAVVGAIVGEYIGADEGLGRVILLANGNFDTTMVFAAITYLTIIGVVLFLAVEALEHVLIPWHVSRRADHSIGKS